MLYIYAHTYKHVYVYNHASLSLHIYLSIQNLGSPCFLPGALRRSGASGLVALGI